jgi:hypothetical protein
LPEAGGTCWDITEPDSRLDVEGLDAHTRSSHALTPESMPAQKNIEAGTPLQHVARQGRRLRTVANLQHELTYLHRRACGTA